MKTAINNTPNNSDKGSIGNKKKAIQMLATLFGAGILLAIGLDKRVLYWIYYKPFYSIFNNSIYLMRLL
jgi:hypothetical protein